MGGERSLEGVLAAVRSGAGVPGLLGLLVAMEAGVPVPVPSDLMLLLLGERVSAGALPLWLAALCWRWSRWPGRRRCSWRPGGRAGAGAAVRAAARAHRASAGPGDRAAGAAGLAGPGDRADDPGAADGDGRGRGQLRDPGGSGAAGPGARQQRVPPGSPAARLRPRTGGQGGGPTAARSARLTRQVERPATTSAGRSCQVDGATRPGWRRSGCLAAGAPCRGSRGRCARVTAAPARRRASRRSSQVSCRSC